MPNTPVPATGEAVSAVRPNRSAIMKDAWANYRRWHTTREGIHGPRAFDRKEFAFLLRCAWHHAKQAALAPVQRRVAAIKAKIDSLKFKSFQINVTPIRARLEAELSALAV